ncbi:MAG: TVP38/TMEM64 family protein [Christensenellales bacterium]
MKKIIKQIAFISTLILIGIGAYFILRAFGLNNIETLRKVANNGIVGAFIYILLQIFQVIFLPINTTMFTIPAIIIFGPFKAFIISWIGCALGSIAMFLIARIWGVKVLKWLVGEEKATKYANLLKKGKYLLPIFLTIPIFPDDIICASAGLGKINFLYFTIVIIITRAIDTACTCFIGSELIKSPIGICLLVLFTIIMLIVGILVTKNQEKVDAWFVNKFSKQKDGRDK